MFHYDGNLLEVVYDTHRGIRESRLALHQITRLVMTGLTDDLLQCGSGVRPAANFAFDKSKRLVNEVAKKFEVSLDTLGEMPSSGPLDSPQATFRPNRDLLAVTPSPPHSTDEYSAPGTPSPNSLLAPNSRHRKSTSQSSLQPSLDHAESRYSNGAESHSALDPQPPTSSQSNIIGGFQQHPVPQRPTVLLAEGHEWKTAKKGGKWANLQGNENLTNLKGRDHVSHFLKALMSADKGQ